MPGPASTPAATLYLVDGYALIYRAFFAMIARPLTTRRGENTSAAWGVTNFLLRLLERRRPDYLAWVHDVGESFRHQTYPQYKATRQKLTEELQQEFDRSVERIEQILEAFRVPLVGVKGYEADDVIGTLATAARGLRVRPPDAARLTELFTELEFRSLIPKLSSLEGAAAEHAAPAAQQTPPSLATLTAVRVEPSIVDDPAKLAAAMAEWRRAPLLALDTETTSLDPMRAELVGMSLAIAPGRSWYLPFGHVAPDGELAGGTPPQNLPPLTNEALAPLRDLLADARVPKAGHNIKYDWLVLPRAGVELAGVSYDSIAASFVLDPGRRSHALDELARERLSLAMRTYAKLVGRGKAERPFAAVPLADAARYCAADSEIVLRLHDAFRPELEDHQLVRLLETIELPLMPVLVDMEARGVCVDLTRLGEISRTFAGELTELERAIYQAAGTDFNINSTPQLRHVLFEKHQLPILKKTKTGPSTDYEVLEQLAAMGHEVPRLLIEYSDLSKLKSTYVDALPGFIHPQTGRIHTSFNQ